MKYPELHGTPMSPPLPSRRSPTGSPCSLRSSSTTEHSDRTARTIPPQQILCGTRVLHLPPLVSPTNTKGQRGRLTYMKRAHPLLISATKAEVEVANWIHRGRRCCSCARRQMPELSPHIVKDAAARRGWAVENLCVCCTMPRPRARRLKGWAALVASFRAREISSGRKT